MTGKIRPDFIGTEDAMITRDGAFPLPEAWKEFVGFDATAYWEEQDREKRRQAQLEKCELEFEDDDPIQDHAPPGYDESDFTEDR